ncbi:MAG: RnfABCDGE type electron transport complex subunit G [Porphyromonas sp.]|uniref:FMN-binding protein n=1 Tax=Porphyromonas sp. TaxID=1924944 RepID=UPI002A75FCCA|nr:RnfABCDGE type electron transport complex subunit G [Porphyromonas sp.]MDY3111936.1 RnfABCDGE type electron transport complex subunit G [Porphyromonas sp.]
MKKLPSTLPNMILSLGIICLIIAGILALVNVATKDTIAQAETKAKVEAIKEIVPAFDNNPYEEQDTVALESEPRPLIVYPAMKGGQPVGYAIETYTDAGFSGHIDIMVGFDMQSQIVGFKVLKHEETPGLGAKIQEWFTSPAPNADLIRDVRRLDMSQASPLKVSKDGGKVDAITAATISSRAFIDAIERAYRVYQSVVGEGGPTAQPTESNCALPEREVIDSLFNTLLPAYRLVDKAKSGTTDDGTPWLIQSYGTNDMSEATGLLVVTTSDDDYEGRCLPLLVCFDNNGALAAFAIADLNAKGKLISISNEYGGNQDPATTKPSKKSLIGKKVTPASLKLRKDGGSIDAVSGSTVSSRAILQGIARAQRIFVEASANESTK